jgi:hypothetical protein
MLRRARESFPNDAIPRGLGGFAPSPRKIGPPAASVPAPRGDAVVRSAPPVDRSTRWRESAWPEWRYGGLLTRAATTRAGGRGYARLVAGVEFLEAARRRRAVMRIQRWQRVSRGAALRIFHASLMSEAREEADSAFFMQHPLGLRGWMPDASAIPTPSGPTLYATLHLGSPVFAYVFLRLIAALDVRAIGRRLDERNPMPAAKRRYGLAKEAWLRGLAGVDLLEPSAHAMNAAREHLLDGRPVFAALDVPGDVVARSTRLAVAGEQVAFSAGAIRIAQLAGARVVPIVALSGLAGLRLHVGQPLDPDTPRTAAVLRTLLGFVHRHPDEWWLWPYVRAVG